MASSKSRSVRTPDAREVRAHLAAAVAHLVAGDADGFAVENQMAAADVAALEVAFQLGQPLGLGLDVDGEFFQEPLRTKFCTALRPAGASALACLLPLPPGNTAR